MRALRPKEEIPGGLVIRLYDIEAFEPLSVGCYYFVCVLRKRNLFSREKDIRRKTRVSRRKKGFLLWPDIIQSVTSDVIRCMSVTQFLAVGHIASDGRQSTNAIEVLNPVNSVHRLVSEL